MAPRHRLTFLSAALAVLLLALPFLQLSAEGGEDVFIIVSITEMGGGRVDVKLMNERTHYVHSITVVITIVINFHVGDRVRERRTESGGILLVRADDTGGSGSGGSGGGGSSGGGSGGGSSAGESPPPPKLPPGYIPLRIENLRVINSYSKPQDAPLSPTWLSPGTCDALANGGFTASGIPAGPVARNGHLDSSGYGKSLTPEDEKQYGGPITTDFRGGVAVRSDGTLSVGRQQGRTWADIQRAFPGVSSFMGGGAMLLEGGNPVAESDLIHRQGFADQDKSHRVIVQNGVPKTGFNADQLRSARHTVVGTRNGQTFLLVTSARTGQQVQKDLQAAGFQDAVMFDGGNGLYFTDGKRTFGKPANNSLGLCVRAAR